MRGYDKIEGAESRKPEKALLFPESALHLRRALVTYGV